MFAGPLAVGLVQEDTDYLKGSPQLTEKQEREVLEKCIELATALTGKKPCGYRAPLYQLSETTIALLEEHGFLYGKHLSNPENHASCDSSPGYLGPDEAVEQSTDSK